MSRILRVKRQFENSVYKILYFVVDGPAIPPRHEIPPFRLCDFTIRLPTRRHWRGAVFQALSFYWLATRGYHRVYSPVCSPRESPVSSFSAAAGSEPRLRSSWMLVYSGVYSLPPSPCFPPRRHPRDPLISGLRGSRNEPSEARWHEEGSVGWVVEGRRRREGSCSKLRYRGLATLTPLHVRSPFAARQQPPSSWKTSTFEGVPYLKTSSSMARLVNVLRYLRYLSAIVGWFFDSYILHFSSNIYILLYIYIYEREREKESFSF